MEGSSVTYNTDPESFENPLETLAKWLSCNGELWGVGPTAVFASAAALFLYNEFQATAVLSSGDPQPRISPLENTLVTTMILGMLALMIHLWVCCMRFVQYYLDTIITDSPSIILEMTTASLFGGHSSPVPLGPLTKFLKNQQPHIHITLCWFLSLCYADYVRKHYCRNFNMPYLEQWQVELHERAVCGVNKTVAKVNSLVGAVQTRLRIYMQPQPAVIAPEPVVNHTITKAEAHPAETSCFGGDRRRFTVKMDPGKSFGTVSNLSKSASATTIPEIACARVAVSSRSTISEICIGLNPESSLISGEAYDKLKAYIQATRCSCHQSMSKPVDPKSPESTTDLVLTCNK